MRTQQEILDKRATDNTDCEKRSHYLKSEHQNQQEVQDITGDGELRRAIVPSSGFQEQLIVRVGVQLHWIIMNLHPDRRATVLKTRGGTGGGGFGSATTASVARRMALVTRKEGFGLTATTASVFQNWGKGSCSIVPRLPLLNRRRN